jgi:hypothetical protein
MCQRNAGRLLFTVIVVSRNPLRIQCDSMKRREWQQVIIFMILGSALLAWAYEATPTDKRTEFLSNALLTAAFVLLAVTLLNLVYWLAGGEPIAARLERLGRDLIASFEILKDAQITGLHRILGTSRDFERMGDNWMGRLVSAKGTVELMGYSLLVWSTGRDFQSELIALIRRGVNIRILVMDPGNPHFGAFVNFHQIAAVSDVTAVKTEVVRAINVFNQVAARVPSGDGVGSFELRKVRSGLIACQICRIDEWLAAIPYLYSVVASESPLLEIRGSGSELFRWYTREFESLWVLNP